MSETKAKRLNRLGLEKSPYLRRHADNPVDWYPWGDEAFLAAAARDRPVFLSIGYSSCHWCHVMERESFSDPEVGRLLNETFICVKVDREERPDIDQVYMTACQHLTGRGGWPLTVILTPDRKPFFAGTYFPKNGSAGSMGLMELVPKVQDLWEKRRQKALQAADEIVGSLARALHFKPGPTPSRGIADRAFAELSRQFDEEFGGFGTEPKFPMPIHLLFLLRHWKRTGDPAAMRMVDSTLAAMRRCGIYDHVGFGFFRYSTDRRWHLPHFEKMLYDQALISILYTEAYQATGRREYAETAKEILSYVLRDMTSPEGAFYSAEDADSNGVEGLFYTWTLQEVQSALDSLESHVVMAAFDLREEGNFRPERGENASRNILCQVLDTAQLSSKLGLPAEDLEKVLESAKVKLLAARCQRGRPLRDQKILADWNGLMIAALARAAAVFEDVRLAEAADGSARFILENLRDPSGRLMHRICDGQVTVEGNLDDYAFLAWGLMELYQSTYREPYFLSALKLVEEMLRLFWDGEGGGFFFTAGGKGPIPVRMKPASDGATPSGNAAAAMVLLKIARLTADPRYEEKVAAIGRAFSGQLERAPSAHPLLAATLNMALGSSAQVVVVGDPTSQDTLNMLAAIRSSYWPHVVSAFIPSTGKGSVSRILVPFARDMRTYEGKATAYVCKDYICRAPTTDPQEMIRTIDEVAGQSRNQRG